MQPTIIITDDDTMFLMIMRRYLNGFGFNVIEDKNGRKIASLIEMHHPVACIIDIFMDDKEGIETIKELANLPNRPKLIATSSNTFYLDIARKFGADAVLIKPVEQTYLAEVLVSLAIALPSA